VLHNLREMIERVVIRRRAHLRRLPNAAQLAVSNVSAGRPRRLRLPTRSEQARQQESRTQRSQPVCDRARPPCAWPFTASCRPVAWPQSDHGARVCARRALS
jgi:hypothetical protein